MPCALCCGMFRQGQALVHLSKGCRAAPRGAAPITLYFQGQSACQAALPSPRSSSPALPHPKLANPPQKLDAAEQQHRRLSSKEAVAEREASGALAQLPKTLMRLQRIFGFQVRVGRVEAAACRAYRRLFHGAVDGVAGLSAFS